ncbi:HPr kinase/phosphorylase [Phreatobacter sp. AB_2022a]|uniref:HPr kinase/phosphorylase n=1 Tax=Phreatobacter sp. AB_2022a TaxID=3003134 RepID=UPI0022874FFF|nr:HPr kinase/phosphatase C-terminal domain-containing protein [Phreatobacter sp. AB_2022a]MCZ0737503.1 HPr kinase/phosphatase C-terminal domain-containing protein [Phreatobacter sp. AB_2022a]
MPGPATVHATAVLVDAKAVLIRGASGAGKSRLALGLIDAAGPAGPRFARLIADDRVLLEAAGGRLIVRAPVPIAGLVEQRGRGVVSRAYEAVAVVGLIVDLDAADAARMPEGTALETVVEGVTVSRLPVASGCDPLPLVLSLLKERR